MRKSNYTIVQMQSEIRFKKYWSMKKFGKATWMYLPVTILDDLSFHKSVKGKVSEHNIFNDKIINLITIIQ
jgi:hypothetical protein